MLHVTECYSAGVGRAIDAAVHVAPHHDHHLLWSGEESPTGRVAFSSVAELPAGLFQRIRATRRQIAEVDPDVVFAHSSWAGVYARAIVTGKPIVYAPHCYKFEDMEGSPFLRRFYWLAEKVLSGRNAVTVVLSPHEDRLAARLNKTGERHFVPNVASALPSAEYPPTNYETGATVVMSGRVYGQKDPEHFARVANLVRAVRPDIEFRWIGDGEAAWREELERNGVIVTGWVQPDRMATELSQPFVYYHSARYEGFPLSVLDAAAFEHPVVVRDIPAFEGFALPKATSDQSAATLLLDVLSGGSTLQSAVSGSRDLVDTMNHERQSAALETLYNNF